MLSTGFMGAENRDIPIGGTVAVVAQGPVGLKHGGTVSNTGYFGEGEFVRADRVRAPGWI